MPDATRLPQGFLLGDTSLPAPVGTIKRAASGAFVRSTSATVATYVPVNGSTPTTRIADPGDGVDLAPTQSGHYSLTIGAGVAELNNLAAPAFLGQLLSIRADVVGGGGTRAITSATALNVLNQAVMTFAAVEDTILLMGMQVGAGTAWHIIFNDGVALA